MTCQTCQAATETNGLCPMYDSPKCIFCTARLIQRIGKLPIAISEATARRRVVLADAVAWGHAELEIRRLVALKVMCVAPVPEKTSQNNQKR